MLTRHKLHALATSRRLRPKSAPKPAPYRIKSQHCGRHTNFGFVGLASDTPLIVEVDAAIGEMLAQNQFSAIALAAGLTYVPPRAPDISADIPIAALRGD